MPFSRTDEIVERQSLKQYTKNPITVGQHLRKKRIEAGLLQREVANILQVSEDSITFWENGRSVPQIHHYQRIIQFLGYMPFEIDISTIAGQIRWYRYEHGLSYKAFGKLANFDPATIATWEENKSYPSSKNLKKLQEFIV